MAAFEVCIAREDGIRYELTRLFIKIFEEHTHRQGGARVGRVAVQRLAVDKIRHHHVLTFLKPRRKVSSTKAAAVAIAAENACATHGDASAAIRNA